MDDRKRYEEGMRVRREVLGNEHVDRALAGTNSLNADFQDFLTRYAWGEVWSRSGLPRHTRSLVTLALMVALNRKEEFDMHVHAALRNGVSEAELRELLLHCALYCGLPSANSAFHWANEILTSVSGGLPEPSDAGN